MTRGELTRRAFLAATTSSVAVVWSGCATRTNSARVVPGKVSPNERLNIAAIGVGGKGFDDTQACSSENLVALCDPDWKYAERSFARFPQARRFRDYRQMLDAMPEIEACIVSTPDHTHAPAAYRAMKLGKHVYVQKPLTHTVAEAALLRKTAREMGVVTQMGNQGHSLDSVRELSEYIWAGAIGPVREVHAWTDRPIWPQGLAAPLPEQPVPDSLDWDIWIGSAPWRPYNEGYAPFNWRGWHDFGTGALGDMACHILDVVWASLRLGEAHAFSVEPVEVRGLTAECYPLRSTLRYAFPERAGMPPCEVYWHDGFDVTNGQKLYNRPELAPELQSLERNGDSNGCLFLGAHGKVATGAYGKDFRVSGATRDAVAPSIPRIHGEDHYQDWIRACKDRDSVPCSRFEVSAPFTQMILAGNVAVRAQATIDFDPANARITNNPDAVHLLTKAYRNGYELPV